jgi:hypothetical protein
MHGFHSKAVRNGGARAKGSQDPGTWFAKDCQLTSFEPKTVDLSAMPEQATRGERHSPQLIKGEAVAPRPSAVARKW